MLLQRRCSCKFPASSMFSCQWSLRDPLHAQGGAGGGGAGATSTESCTHPAKRDRCFPPPIAERQRLPNVGIPGFPVWEDILLSATVQCMHVSSTSRTSQVNQLGQNFWRLVWVSALPQHAQWSLVLSRHQYKSSSSYTLRFNEVERGVYWFRLVRLSVCGQNHVRSVSSTILIGSISYLHFLSSNFRRCVACKVCSNFFKFVTLTLSSFDLGSNMTQ